MDVKIFVQAFAAKRMCDLRAVEPARFHESARWGVILYAPPGGLETTDTCNLHVMLGLAGVSVTIP